MKRHLHYEAAFENYLLSRCVPYAPVDESRRRVCCQIRIKSFDLLVYPAVGRYWIADIKGRRFPYPRSRGQAHYWENWVTRADLDGLAAWERSFGQGFESRFVFAYLLEGPPNRWPVGRPHSFRGAYYAFLSISLADYAAHARVRSLRWETLSMSSRSFRDLARPVGLDLPFCPAPARRVGA